MRPVRSWALSTPVASIRWAVSRSPRKSPAAVSPGICSKMSLAMAKMGQ